MAVAYDGSTLAREHGFQAHVGPMRSKSRGWVRLKSLDPAERDAFGRTLKKVLAASDPR